MTRPPAKSSAAAVSVAAGMILSFSLSKSRAVLNYIGDNPFTDKIKEKENAEAVPSKTND